MCKGNSRNKIKVAREFKANSPDKNEGNTGCVRETPEIKIKVARDV